MVELKHFVEGEEKGQEGYEAQVRRQVERCLESGGIREVEMLDALVEPLKDDLYRDMLKAGADQVAGLPSPSRAPELANQRTRRVYLRAIMLLLDRENMLREPVHREAWEEELDVR
jgi:hypothetical protein